MIAESTIQEPEDPLTLKGEFGWTLKYVSQRFDLESAERRTYRARTEPMLVVPETYPAKRHKIGGGPFEEGEATGIYTVFSSSGSEYEVDLAERACTCPDMQENPPETGCKHFRRVALMVDGDQPLPARGEDARGYWDWFFETVRAVNRCREGLDSDLQNAVTRAASAGHKQDADYQTATVEV